MIGVEHQVSSTLDNKSCRNMAALGISFYPQEKMIGSANVALQWATDDHF
jgi:hypothetical protein